MKFKIDQNLPIEAADLLTAAGHDAVTVYQQSLSGAPDERIVEVCNDEHRILVTADLDLSDIRRYPPSQRSPPPLVLRSNCLRVMDASEAVTMRRNSHRGSL